MDVHKLQALPLVADARRALTALHRALKERGYAGTTLDYRDQVREKKREWDALVTDLRAVKTDAPGKLAEIAVIGLVNESFGGKATVVCAAGGLPGELLRLWRPEDPKAYHLEYGYSCMGYEIAGGLGVKLADPEREVVVMVGDGSYLMMNSEIVTAVAEGIRITIVVVDNHGYQCILGLQRAVGVADFGNELRFRGNGNAAPTGPYVPVDFPKHAESMGARAFFATTAAEVKDALAQARQSDRIAVVVVPVDPESRMPGMGTWWDVPVAEVSAAEGTRKTRESYEAAARNQRPVIA
jgi:3D-(3,5/4)-trihydroxycyclohexane-1,2-dione acylhydrolase (decyclizing)